MSFDAYTTSGQGQNLFQQLCVQAFRDPVNGVDLNDANGGPYQIGRRWFNKTNANYWHYIGQGIWIKDAGGGAGAILDIAVPAGASPIFPDATGQVGFTSTGTTITITGAAGGLGAQTINFDVAGGAVIGKVAVDASTPPGTNPVLPTANQITIEGGATFATGTSTKPIRTDSLAASTIDLEIQLAGNNAATASSSRFGVSQFDANQFDVTSGFVQLKGGGVNPALTKLAVQTGTNPVVPSATGQITFNGATVVAGTNPVRTDGTGANTVALEVQRSQAIAGTDSTKIGLAAFDSASFGVDANGFVTLNGGEIINIPTTSWTPILNGSTPGSVTYSVQSGKYSRTGSVVVAAFEMTWSATTASGDVIISGWPVNFEGSLNRAPLGQIWVESMAFPAMTAYCVLVAVGTQAYIYGVPDNGIPARLQLSAPGTLHGTITYFVT